MADSDALGTPEGNRSFLMNANEIGTIAQENKTVSVQQPNQHIFVAQAAEKSKTRVSPTTDAGENAFGVEIEFGAAEPSGKPIRAKLKSDEEAILKKKLGSAVPPLPVIANVPFLLNLPDGSLVIEIANFLTSDLFSPACSYAHSMVNNHGLLPTVKAGAREVTRLSIKVDSPHPILFSYQITSELKILVCLVLNKYVVVALAPSQYPLTDVAVAFFDDDEDDFWNDDEALKKKQLWSSSCDRSGVKLPNNALATARNGTFLAGVRLIYLGSSCLQIGIANDARENPTLGYYVCTDSASKRQRLGKPENKLNAQGDLRYCVKRVFGARTTAMKSNVRIPKEVQPVSPLEEMTVNQILERKLALYGYVLEIENFLEVDLKEVDYCIDADDDEKWIPTMVRAKERDVVVIKMKNSGYSSDGVIVYQIGDTDLRIAVMFRLLKRGNEFAAAFIPALGADWILVGYLTSGIIWSTSPDRKFGQAQNGDLVIEVRNIRARVTMTNDFKALMKIQIKTY